MVGELVNPYIAGAPVTEARMFFGREDVFDWIQNSLMGKYADHILVIHGQRRVGKTSVLKQLGNRLPQRYIPVFFDLQGRTHTTLDRFLWWLAREIVRVLKQERGLEIPAPEKDAFSADPDYFESRFLANLLPMLDSSSLLLTFDEFDNLEENEIKETLARPLVDHLRRLMGRQGLNFIFSIGSSGRKLENMQADYTEFFKTALYKKISFLNEEQTQNLITRPVEAILEYDRHAINRIYKVAGGHPYFTQLTCHELFARCQQTDQRHIRENDVEAILDDVVERGTVNLKFVWDEASDIEKWTLASLAHLEKSDKRTLTDYLQNQHVRFSDSDLTSSLLHLREKDILTPENHFVIHLLRLWLQKNRPFEQVREELTEVNPIANRYIEIGLEFKNSGQYEKAIESFQEALAISAGNIQAQVNIALVYMDQKDYDRAVIEFEKALTIDDEDVTARAGMCEVQLALGDAATQKGRWREAAQSYRRVLAINEEHTEARQRMAEISRQRAEKALDDGRDEEALSAFSEAMKYAPEDDMLAKRVETVKAEKKAKVVAAQIARSEKEANAKNWEAAVRTLEEASHLAPDDPNIQRRLSEGREKLREVKLAALQTKGQAAVKVGKFGEALRAWQDYASLEPDDRGKAEAEIARLRKLVELEEVYNKAQEALAGRSYDKAISLLKEVIVQDENFKDTSRLLVQAIELRRSSRPARITLPVAKILKGLFITIAIAGLGVGGYFAWNRWGSSLTGLFASEQKIEKVCFLMTGMDEARSYWNSQISRSMDDAANAYGLESKTFITQMDKESHQARLTSMIKTEKCDLILGNGTWLKDSFLQFAKEYPNVKFSLIDVDYGDVSRPLPENLIEQTFKTFDSGYMAGYLAAGLTKTGSVGTFGAEESESVKEYMKGFVKGVEDYNGRHNTQVLALGFNIADGSGLFGDGYQRTSGNIELHKLRADTLINKENVDVLFIVSSPEISREVIDFTSSAKDNEEFGVKIIGSEIDLYAFIAPANEWRARMCITSATKNFEAMVKEVIAQTFEGTYRGETIEGNGTNQGVGLAAFNESIFVIPDEVKNDLAQLQQEVFGITVTQEGTSVTAPPTATPDPRILNPANQHMYLYMEQAVSWGDARDICASQGGYLATIQNAEENEFIYRLTNGNSWLGATDQVEEGIWVWLSGEPWEYQNWEQGEPSNGNQIEAEHYLSIEPSSLWNDVPDVNNPFICEWEPDTPVLDPAVQTALYTIQNGEPTFQTSFDAWDFGDPNGNARVEDGKLIVTSESMEDIPDANVSNFPANRFALEYEFRILELVSPESICGSGYVNDFNFGEESWRQFFTGFNALGKAILGYYEYPDQFPILADVGTAHDFSKTNTFTLIVLGDQITAFLNGQFVYTVQNPVGSAIYTQQRLSAAGQNTCEFDNYKFWDLSGVDLSVPAETTTLESPTAVTQQPSWVTDFAQPILDTIADRAPNFQDNFGTGSAGWEKDYCPGDMKYINEELIIRNCRVYRSNIDWRDFAVEFDIRYMEGTAPTSYFSFQFRDLGNAGHSIRIDPNGDVLIGFAKTDGVWLGGAQPAYQTNHILLIARGNRFAFYLNGEPFYYTENDAYPFGRSIFYVENPGQNTEAIVALDNFQIWDISNVAIP